jgi:serine/tyrosine/threonine adenylyltransferase
MSAVASLSGAPLFRFDNSYARELVGLFDPWQAAGAPAPELLALNRSLAAELGVDPDALAGPDGIAVLAGNAVAEGSQPIALAYAGHQFGNYSPRLGDGRALLLGEIVDARGARHDLHLKGSGRTRFARGGDGKAAVGPMLREYVISEAMHALGIPTTRSLAVIATGERIARDTGMLPGAVLARVASSHLRVGSFQYAAATGDTELLRRLVDHAIARHLPEAADADVPALALYRHVVARQAELVAGWMHVGFVHGVMNTDNTTISGETIDYGPCAFMDRFDTSTVFSSIDHGGRYAYGNQPRVLQWNLARLAETLLSLFDPDTEQAVALATEVLQGFGDQYLLDWRAGMRDKLGLGTGAPDLDPGATPDAVVDAVPALLQSHEIDHTRFFRLLSTAVRGDDAPVRGLFAEPAAFEAWAVQWRTLLPVSPEERLAVAATMDRVNPLYVPRNHMVEAALDAATEGEMGAFDALVAVVSRPFDERPGLEAYALPAAADQGPYRTFCGT